MSKLTRIIKQLQKAKGKGVEENDLMNDFETSGNARVIRHRINKILQDRNGVETKDGVWYLSDEYWQMTMTEFKDLLNRFELREITTRNNLVTLAVVAILAMLVILSYYAGRPETFDQCAEIFGYEAIIEIE